MLTVLYAVISAVAICFNVLIARYGRIRSWVARSADNWFGHSIEWLLETFVLPRVSEWHVLLSSMLLSRSEERVEVDVLLKSGILYRGTAERFSVGAGGNLASLTLENTQRFKREEFVLARTSLDPAGRRFAQTRPRRKIRNQVVAANAKPALTNRLALKPEDFWTTVRGDGGFVIIGSEIATINRRVSSEGISQILKKLLQQFKPSISIKF